MGGETNQQSISADPELNPLHDHPDFIEFMAGLKPSESH